VKLPEFITFDCYGTLTDFAINDATIRLLGSRLEQLDDVNQFLRAFSKVRFNEVQGEYRSYKEVIRDSARKAFTQFNLGYRDADGDALVAAIPTFQPFPDVPPILERLRQSCKLVIISNTDDDLIAENVRSINVPFHAVVTAEQARAYKPSLDAFNYLIGQLGCRPDDILHVAQGFYYDIVPASKLGWKRVWINRNGWPGHPEYGPYHEMPDLTGLPDLLGLT
jgi:2-haloacid dehalogenase